VVFLYRSVAEPQRDLGTQASPSRNRSPDPKVVVESLGDDTGTATPPPAVGEKRTASLLAADSRTASPPHADDAGAGGAVGDVGTPTSPRIIDVDPISARPGGVDNDLVKDRAQIDQAPRGRGRLACRYLVLPRQARGCRDEKLTGITLLGRRISSMTMKICRPCGPAL
jgi:hypothetical protein